MWLRIAALLAWAGTLFGQPVAKLYTVSVLAGAPHTYPDGVPAMGALFESVSGVWASGSGEILITDADNHCVRRILADGTIRTVAGVCGKSGYSGSGKPALESLLNRPAVAVEDRQGNIYIADTGNSRIRKVTPEGVMTDYAGTGDFGLSGDEGPAANARLGNPVSLWLDAAGNLYFADPAFNVVRKVWANGRISRVAGNGVPGVADTETYGPEARINLPYGITGDAEGNVYFCERGNHAIRKVAPDGTMRLVAGLRKPGFGGDGGKATDGLLNSPTGVALDRQGNLYISDTGNHVIRKVSPAGVITTVAGVRPGNTPNFGTFGDGGPALAAALNQPLLITLDRNGDLLIADSGNRRVRLLVLSSPAPTLRTVAGRWQDIGDGGPARAAGLYRPHGVAVDKAGNVFIADTGNNRIRKVSPEGMITTVAGDGEAGFRGDGQNAARAMLSAPWDLVFDAAGHLLFSDRDNFRVRRISPEGVIQTVAGSGEPSDTPGALNIREAALWLPLSLAVDPKGYAYVSTNGRVRQLDFTFGHIRDFAGRPFAPFLFGGDSGPAVEALIGYATGIAADSLGSIWISDGPNQVVREVDRDNRIHSRVGFPLRSGYSGDGGFAGAARLNYPAALAFDQPGNLYIVDSGNHRIRRLNTAGIMETIAGGGKGFQEGAFATAVEFDDLGGMTVAGDGSIYLVEKARHRVLKLTPVFPATLRITTGDLQEGPAGRQLPGPLSVTVTDASGRVLVPGVGVKFSTVYGAAALSAAEVVTDANGAASVTVTLGNQTGPVTVRAEADGLAPVTFRLTATAPLAAAPPAVTQYSATRLAGAPRRRDGEPQTALFDHPEGVALDAAGNLYVADTRNHQIRKISPDGMVSTVAGTGAPGYSGDGGPATAAELNGPRSPGVAEDGSVYFVDAWNHVVRRISPEGVITTVFGNGQRGYSGDGRTGPEAQLNSPTALALAPSGLLVADAGNFRVRRLGTDGLVRTVAGTGVAGFSGDFGSPVLARISAVSSLAVDPAGNVFLADTGNHRIRRLRTPGSLIDTYAGNGKPGFGPEGAKAAEAALGSPGGLAVGADGSLYAATEGRIARVRNTGELETYTEAASPGLLSAGPDGALYFTSGNKVWKIDAATRSAVWLAGAEHVGGDGGPAAEAIFDSPNAVLATAGGILVADPAAGNIRRIAPDGNIATLLDASSGIRTPAGMAADAEGNLYVSDQKSGAVFRLTPGGELTTIAPEGSFTSPAGLASDAAGNLYVADMGGHVIQKVGRDGTISTVAGTGKAGYNGDGRPGPLAQIDRPYGLALDAAGNLYFTEAGGHRVRRLAPSGVIYTVAGAGKPGFSGDGGPAAAAQLDSPSGIAVDAEGNLYVADSGNLRLRKISPSGGIASVEGMTLPQAATLFSLDGGGRIYIADPTAGSVRALAPLTR